MNDTDFEKALQAVFDEQCREIDNADIPQYEFSDKFEKKMNRIIRKRKKPVMRAFNTFGKRAACIALCFLIVSSVTVFSVDALRNKFLSLWIDEYEDHSNIMLTEPDETAPEYIEERYAITYDLSDYELYYEDYDYTSITLRYRKGDIDLGFSQSIKENYKSNVNSEGGEITYEKINGKEAIYFCNKHNYHWYIWDNGDYVLRIIVNSTKEEARKIAESVQKVESTFLYKFFVQFWGSYL